MPIQPFHAPASPIDAISKALGVVHDIYGIKQAGAAQDMLAAQTQYLQQKTQNEGVQSDIQNEALKAQADPTSNESKFARAELSAGLDAYAKSGYTDQGTASKLKGLINGTPDETDEDGNVVKPGSPGLSAIAISKNPELSALSSFVKGEQSAKAMAAAATARSAPQTARLEETKNQNSVAAGNSFENDPIIKLSKTNLNSLTRSQSILDNPNKPVTTNDLNLAYNDYINAVAAGGAATEGKIQRELPETWATQFNSLKGKAGEFDDLRQNETGAQLIGMLKQNIGTVRNDISNAVRDQAANRFDDYKASTNQKVQEVAKGKLLKYAPDVYAQKFGQQSEGPTESTPSSSSSMRSVSNDEINQYAQKHGMDPAEASKWLSSQGYKVGG